MSFRKMMPLLILIAVIVIGAAFMPLILGTVDAGKSTNISQEYQDQINSSNNVNIVTVSLSRYAGLVLGIVFICMTLLYVGKKMR